MKADRSSRTRPIPNAQREFGRSPHLLIAERDPQVLEMLTAYFQSQGYIVSSSTLGEEALLLSGHELIDLVLLDDRLPDMDGYELAKRIRDSHRTRDVPIIFLAERRDRAERLMGLELPADDYINKPFDATELRLRVRNTLRRSTKMATFNPVTSLPEGSLVDGMLEECLFTDTWALLMVALDNLGAFQESYGFLAANDVLRAISQALHNARRELDAPEVFIGHLTHTEFILIAVNMHGGEGYNADVPDPTTYEAQVISTLSERIRSRLGQSLDFFYPLKDRLEGGSSGGIPESALSRSGLTGAIGGEVTPPDRRLALRLRTLLPDSPELLALLEGSLSKYYTVAQLRQALTSHPLL